MRLARDDRWSIDARPVRLSVGYRAISRASGSNLTTPRCPGRRLLLPVGGNRLRAGLLLVSLVICRVPYADARGSGLAVSPLSLPRRLDWAVTTRGGAGAKLNAFDSTAGERLCLSLCCCWSVADCARLRRRVRATYADLVGPCSSDLCAWMSPCRLCDEWRTA
jgi:hypothetical protein